MYNASSGLPQNAFFDCFCFILNNIVYLCLKLVHLYTNEKFWTESVDASTTGTDYRHIQ